MGEPAEVLYHDDALQLFVWRDLFVQRWIGVGNVGHAQRMLEAHLAFVTRHGAGRTIAISHIETEVLKPPDDATRVFINRHTAEVSPNVRASATVIETSGFSGAMVRGILSGLMLIMRNQTPHKVTATLREGLVFVLRHRAPDLAPIDLDELDRIYREAAGQRPDRVRIAR